MATFPNSFAEQITPLKPNLGERGNAALTRLSEKGFIVATGLTPYLAGAIGIMGQQPHIKEYCPKDGTPARFGTQESTRRWLQKGGGRAMFLLMSQAVVKDEPMGEKLEGYGWTGVEACDELPDYPITSAYRLGESALGKGLAGDFIQTVVSGTHTLFAPNEGIGLETWKSNHAAGLYIKVGFVPQEQPNEHTELRPTLTADAENGKVMDTRRYMGYPTELLG
jgi:hypothetical protein